MNSILYYLKECFDRTFWVGRNDAQSQNTRMRLLGLDDTKTLDDLLQNNVCFWMLELMMRSFGIAHVLNKQDGLATMYIPKEVLELSREVQEVIIYAFIRELRLALPGRNVIWKRMPENDMLRITWDPIEYFGGIEEVPMKLVDSQQKV